MHVAVVIAFILFIFFVNDAITWAPSTDRSISRENFRIEAFTQRRFFGLETRDDVDGMQNKLNQLFPKGTPLVEFQEFTQGLMQQQPKRDARRQSSSVGYVSSCNFIQDEKQFACVFDYSPPPRIALNFNEIWVVVANYDEHKRLTKIIVALSFR